VEKVDFKPEMKREVVMDGESGDGEKDD